jgi:hypothetical protein
MNRHDTYLAIRNRLNLHSQESETVRILSGVLYKRQVRFSSNTLAHAIVFAVDQLLNEASHFPVAEKAVLEMML